VTPCSPRFPKRIGALILTSEPSGWFHLDHDADDAPPFPWSVKVAGQIWIGIGVLGLIGIPITLMVGLCAALIWLVVLWKFVNTGLDTARGEALDTLRDGIGSIGIGLLALGLCGFLVYCGAIGAGAALAAPGALLVAAGSLAVGGRTQYLEWRELHPPEELPAYDPDRDLRDNTTVRTPE